MEKRNVLILGGEGRLGAALTRAYKDSCVVTSLGRRDADLSQTNAVDELIRKSGANVVINCAAMTNVDLCESERDLAELVNATAPGIIGEAAKAIGARLVHISTDYVFSGKNDRPYAEDDKPDPASWYGITKMRGEHAVMASQQRHSVARVAWVFGPDRDSFLDKAIQAAARGELVSAVSDKFSSPTYTLDVADVLRVFFDEDAPGGIYHICNRGVCSWSEWAQFGIESAIRQGASIKPQTVAPLKLTDIKAMVARRPAFSAMSCRKIEALLGRPIRDWRSAVDDYIALLISEGRIS